MARVSRSRLARLERQPRRGKGTIEEVIIALAALDEAEASGASADAIAELQAGADRAFAALPAEATAALAKLAQEDAEGASHEVLR